VNGAVIRVENLARIYRTGRVEVPALKGVSLTIGRGEFVAVMGPSGSGKSTFLNLVGCLDHPTSGAYFLDGTDVATLSDDQLAAIRRGNQVVRLLAHGDHRLFRAGVAVEQRHRGVARIEHDDEVRECRGGDGDHRGRHQRQEASDHDVQGLMVRFVAASAVLRYARRAIVARPPMYGRSTAGTSIEPSARW